MGFGTLFIGYFFLINPTYFQYTDIIGAVIMLLALYRLSTVNKDFFYGMIVSAVFSLFSLGELALILVDMFLPSGKNETVISYLSSARYIIIFVLTVFILRGIADVSKEVGAGELNKQVKTSLPLSLIFVVAAFFEIPLLRLISGVGLIIISWGAFITLLAIVVYVINMLVTIYRAYMQICMPEDELPKPKKSKGGFMDKYWAHIEEKNRKYAEYKTNSHNNKKNKRKK